MHSVLPLEPVTAPAIPARLALPALLAQRSATRGFTNQRLPDGCLEDLLVQARRAPSGANLQPGEFISLEGDARARLSSALVGAFRSGAREAEDYSYFPVPMPHSLRRRQVAAAQALYGALGAERDDRAARDAQFERNFRFFDAPTAVLVLIDARMGSGCYMDLGMCLFALMMAADAQGIGTCPIGAIASYPGLVRATLALRDDQHVVCGLALGYADPLAPENAVRTARRPLEDYFSVMR
jgi:nitroreductase